MLSGAAARDPKAFSSREIEGMSEASAPKRVTRRTIAKGAAWTVPAVVVAAPAASAATSGPVIPSFDPGTFCKHPPTNQYHGGFCFNNTSDESITITFTEFAVDGNLNGTFTVIPGAITPATLTVGAGVECCIQVDSANAGSMANGQARLSFSYPYGGDTVRASVKTEVTNDLPPCDNVDEPKSIDDPHTRTC